MSIRSFTLLLALSATLGGPGLAWAHADHGKPAYGGVVAEAGHAQFEVVPGKDAITVYATQHGQALATEGASGKLIVLEAGGKREVPLTPAGGNRLTAPGALGAGAKLLIQVQWPGQPLMQGRAQWR